MATLLRVTRPNARFQQWEALLRKRHKRQQAGEFVVQGVRPINLALNHDWPIRAVLYNADCKLSRWAAGVLEKADGYRAALSSELLHRLSDATHDVPELLLLAELPKDDLSRLSIGPDFLGMVFDRPAMPGNIGTIVRSLDAFNGAGLIITGHAADPYDPKTIRASTGSIFAVPVVRQLSHLQVLRWVRLQREEGNDLTIIGTDENGSADIADLDLTGPTLFVTGNETFGMSAGWRDACDVVARIPIGGAASSLNAASAATVVLYEAVRQRGSSDR